MSYIGNPPVVQSSRLVYEETAATAKTAFTPPGGYTVGQLEVYINGAQLMSDDFSATDGSTVNLTTACAIGDGFKSIAYGNFLTTNALNKTGDTMTGPLTLGGLLNTGATGQIKFPAAQNASADANTLDDYEEGTWTPTDASGAGLTITNNGCTYTKIGDTCYLRAYMSYPATANVSACALGGLPFAASNWGGVSILSSNTSQAGLVRAVSGQTKVDFKYNINDSSMSNNQLSGLFVIFSIAYKVA